MYPETQRPYKAPGEHSLYSTYVHPLMNISSSSMTSFGGKTMNASEVIDDIHGIVTANGATAWHFVPDIEAEICGVSQCHHVHAELLCDQCTVVPAYPMSEDETSTFSYKVDMTINQLPGNQSNTQPTFKSLSAIDQYLKLKAFFFQRVPPGRIK